jgi:IS66 C-terminal element/Transposase IS66 family
MHLGVEDSGDGESAAAVEDQDEGIRGAVGVVPVGRIGEGCNRQESRRWMIVRVDLGAVDVPAEGVRREPAEAAELSLLEPALVKVVGDGAPAGGGRALERHEVVSKAGQAVPPRESSPPFSPHSRRGSPDPEHGELSIDDNLAERMLRAQAIRRRNWTFLGSDRGGRTTAVLYSLTGSCRHHDIDPFAYRRDVLSRLPTHPAGELDEFLPDVWFASHPSARRKKAA